MNILLSGTYSSFNKGDAAMEISAAAALRNALPLTPEVMILSPFPAKDGPFYHPIPVIFCDRRRLVRGSLNLLWDAAWRRLSRLGAGSRRLPLLGISSRKTAESDILVDLSGDMLTEDYGAHVAYSHFIPLLRALAVGRRYMICAQSIGPFRLTKPLAKYLLNRAAAITVRDPISLAYLEELGIDGSRVSMTADLAFTLVPVAPEAAEQHLREAGLTRDGGDILGVSVSRLVADRFDRRAGASGSFVDLIARVIAEFAQETGSRVLFTPHVTGPGDVKDDRIISRQVRERLPGPVEASVIDADLRPDEIKAVIGQCALFVGTRMHANIAALSSRVPTVAIAYSHKTPGIMRACGMEAFAIDVNALTGDGLLGLLQQAHARRDEIIATLSTTIPEQQRLAMKNIEILGELLEHGREP